MQDAKKEATPSFAILTHVQCCRVRGRKQFHCLGKGTTLHTCKHCCLQSQHMQNVAGCKEGSSSIVPCIAWESLSTEQAYCLQSQHKLNGARCQEGTTPTHAECCRMRGRKQLHCSSVATTHHSSMHRCLQSQHMQNVAGCKEGSSSVVLCIAWESLSTGASTAAYNLNTS